MAFDAETTERTVTRDRVMRLRDHLARLPAKLFNMSDWGNLKCGTPACIGGWANTLFSPNDYVTSRKMGALLGMTRAQSDELFFDLQTTEKQYHEITTANAVAVLDHYLATGEIDWGVAK